MSTVKKIPMRKCTGCGEMKPKKEMVRIVKTTESDITLDLTGKLNGRGAYLCRNAECLKKALTFIGNSTGRQRLIDIGLTTRSIASDIINIYTDICRTK